MKIDQIAFYAASDEEAARIKSQFKLTNAEWIKDTVTARSHIIDIGWVEEQVAELQFNYTLGIELEILRYIKGPSWHHSNPLLVPEFSKGHKIWNVPSFISHVGIHLEDGESFPKMADCKLVQETLTKSHTSDYLTQPDSPGYKRTYHYKIFELSPGSYIKYIKRLHP